MGSRREEGEAARKTLELVSELRRPWRSRGRAAWERVGPRSSPAATWCTFKNI